MRLLFVSGERTSSSTDGGGWRDVGAARGVAALRAAAADLPCAAHATVVGIENTGRARARAQADEPARRSSAGPRPLSTGPAASSTTTGGQARAPTPTTRCGQRRRPAKSTSGLTSGAREAERSRGETARLAARRATRLEF